MKASEILRTARQKIERTEAWTQGCYARDSEGSQCWPAHPYARSWCGFGALKFIESQYPDAQVPTEEKSAFDYLDDATPGLDFIDWQDEPERSHTDVLRAFDLAIELAEADEAAS